MLAKQGIIADSDAETIITGLASIREKGFFFAFAERGKLRKLGLQPKSEKRNYATGTSRET